MHAIRSGGAAKAAFRALCLGAVLTLPLPGGAVAAPQCGLTPVGPAIPLPKAAETLARTRHLTIVAIGSSSTVGVGASSPAKTYPAVLEAVLRARFPGAEFTMINKGVNGEDVPENLRRFERDVAASKPDVVLWQVGTNYALRNFGVGDFGNQLRSGLDLIRSYGAEAVLIDLQYSPWVNLDPDTPAMNSTIAAVGKQAGVPVVDRYAMMRKWVEQDKVPLSSLVILDGLHLTDMGYDCFGRLLGERLAAGLGTPPAAIAQSGGPASAQAARRTTGPAPAANTPR